MAHQSRTIFSSSLHSNRRPLRNATEAGVRVSGPASRRRQPTPLIRAMANESGSAHYSIMIMTHDKPARAVQPQQAAAANQQPSLDPIMQLGLGFWGSKTLLSAIELGVFTLL